MIAEKLSRKLTWIDAQSFEDSNTSTHVPIGPHIERRCCTFRHYDIFDLHGTLSFTLIQKYFVYLIWFIRGTAQCTRPTDIHLISSPGLPHDPSHPENRSQTLKQLTIGWDWRSGGHLHSRLFPTLSSNNCICCSFYWSLNSCITSLDFAPVPTSQSHPIPSHPNLAIYVASLIHQILPVIAKPFSGWTIWCDHATLLTGVLAIWSDKQQP